MLDKWFIEEVNNKLKQADRVVIIDEQKKADFLFDSLKKVKTDKIFTVSTEIEELKTKYEIEKKYRGKKVLVIAYIPLERLKFLREYAETGACLPIKHLHRYIQSKVREKMNFDINLSAEEIIALGKLSIGKGKEYWKRIKTKSGAFTEEDILKFLAEPKEYFTSSGIEVQKFFIEFMSDFAEYSLENKPADTIAKEIAFAIFENLLYKKKSNFLDQIYKQWVDSKKYESVLQIYIKQYILPSNLDIWMIPLNHPFQTIDREWLEEVIQHLNNRRWLEEKLSFIEGRATQPITAMLGIDYWQSIFTLLDYNPEKLTQICNLNDTIEHYKNTFYKIDQSIRHLYTQFLSEKKILQPLQDYYRKILQLFLDKWFTYFQEQYQEEQAGLLKKIIQENRPSIAIILGDAISYEVAKEIAKGMVTEYKIKDTILCGGYPSTTEINMSRMFTTSERILKTRGEREQILLKELKQDIKFNNLDELSIGYVPENDTVFYAADVDSISEKEGQSALKYYDKFIENIQEKIDCLFKCGYKKVFLVSDHGFVLSGLLEEADKIEFGVPQGEKFERYCLSKEKIDNLPVHIIGFKKPYKEFEYIYFSTTLNPFKTPGPYGFAHGGITPQELLIPFLQIEKFNEDVNKLKIEITNKDELSSVVGDIYPVRLKAGINPGEIFSGERKIVIVMVKDKHEFSQSDVITMHEEEGIIREFNFSGHNEFEIIVLDDQSKTRLDFCTVKRNITRDLGGLGEKK
jgi:hypothetical protein